MQASVNGFENEADESADRRLKGHQTACGRRWISADNRIKLVTQEASGYESILTPE